MQANVLDGGPNSAAISASSDGSIIVGWVVAAGQQYACWWDQGTGAVTHLNLPATGTWTDMEARGCASDGSVIVGFGQNTSDSHYHAFWWSKSTGVITELLPESGGGFGAQAYACSGNGSIIIGNDVVGSTGHAVWWNQSTGAITALGQLPSSTNGGNALNISSDGTVIVGVAYDSSNNPQPVWWNQSTGAVTAMAWQTNFAYGSPYYSPYDCSSDGSVIVGTGEDATTLNDVPLWWDKSTGTPTILNSLPGSTNGAGAFAVSDDGLTIAGYANDVSSVGWGILWNKTSGTISEKLPYPPSGSPGLDQALGISADATTPVGKDGSVGAIWWGPSGTPFAISGSGLAGASGHAALAITTPIRGQTRAGGSGSAALSWSAFPLSITGTGLAGAKGSAGLVPPDLLLGGQPLAEAYGRAVLIDITFLPIFPTLPVGFPVTVKPIMANVVGQIPVGRDMRAPEQTLPIWEIDLNFEELRDQTQNSAPYSELAGFTDFMQLAQLFLGSVGQYGQFLFDAPWDDSRADQVIATGDGTTKTFFMVRTWGYGQLGFTEPVGAVNSVLNVKINGTILSPTLWTIVDRNILTFATAPANGAIITSTFSYYYRCQWTEDQQQYEEFFKDRWTIKVKMRSVQPQLPEYLAVLPTLLSPGPIPPIPVPPSPTSVYSLSNPLAVGGLSEDGSILLGRGNIGFGGPYPTAWWTKTNFSINVTSGMVSTLFSAPWTAARCSADGTIGVTNSSTNSNIPAWIDIPTGIVTPMQQYMSGFPGNFPSGISADGSIIVGGADNLFLPVWWDRATGNVTLLALRVPINSGGVGCATDVSADGAVIVGEASAGGPGNYEDGVWWDRVHNVVTALDRPFTFSGTTTGAQATGCSYYGDFICGFAEDSSNVTHAVWWSKATGAVTILTDFGLGSFAYDISDDGR